MKHAGLVLFFFLLLLTAVSRAGEATYELHEWGVFPVPRNAAWAMLDTRAELSSMPKFFWKVWPGAERLPWMGDVSKPVIYLYAEKPLSLELKIRFADGRPLVWWPAASSPVAGLGEQPQNELIFSPRVGDVAPPGSWQRKRLDEIVLSGKKLTPFESRGLVDTPLPEVEKGHWVEELRNVPSAKVYTSGGHGKMGYQGDQVEKFIYYDGLMKAPETPQVAREGEALVLKSNVAYALADVMVVERDGARTRIAKWANVPAGEQTTRIEMIAAGDAKGDPKAIEKTVEEFVQRLVAAGLTKEEAVGLEKVWHPGLFSHGGLSLFYRVPQSVYDQWLPLTAKPEPKKIVRVGLVLHQHLEPELEANVTALLKKMSAEDFTDRQKAMQALMNIGGAAFPFLEAAIKNKDTELETANNCRKILNLLDTRPALEPKKDEQQK